MTPSGVRYQRLTPDLVGVHRLDGTPVEAPLAPTSELPLHLAIYRALDQRTGCLMRNHGAVTAGPDLDTALDKSSYLEWLCDVSLRAAAAGTPRLLSPAELDAAAAKLAGYGQQPPPVT